MSQSSVNLEDAGFVTIDEVGEEDADDSVQILVNSFFSENFIFASLI